MQDSERNTDAKKYLLVLTSDFPPIGGGMSAHTLGLCQALHDSGRTVVILAPKTKGGRNIDSDLAFTVLRFASGMPRVYTLAPLLYKACCQLLRSDYDAMYATSWYPDGLAAFILSQTLGVPYFIAAHGGEILRTSRVTKGWRKACLLLTLRNSAGIYAASRFTRDVLIRLGVEANKVIALGNAVDIAHFYPSADLREKGRQHLKLRAKRVILTVGRLTEYKGQDMVLQCIPYLLKEIPSVHYVIVGKGDDYTRLKLIVQRLELQDCVTFAGYVSDEELPTYYNVCDVFVMPSREIQEAGEVEGFGIVYLEASACGKPVIGGRSGGVEDAIIHGETGLLVNPEDRGELEQALKKLLRDDALAGRLGDQGRRRVLENFTWKHIAQRFDAFIENRLRNSNER